MVFNVAMQSAVSGLQNAQRAIDTISNNIVNAGTPGYTRKMHNQQARTVAGVGQGVMSLLSTRQVDESLLRQIRLAGGVQQAISTRVSFLERIQDLFGSPDTGTNIGASVTNLGSSFSQLALDPSSSLLKSMAVDSLNNTTTQINRLSLQIQSLRQQADVTITTLTSQINGLLELINKLNIDIARLDNTKTQSSADLWDKRDQAMKELSLLMDYQTFTRNTGEVVIMTNGGVTLVDTTANTVSHASGGSLSPWLDHASGAIGPITVAGVDITRDIKSGQIAGLIEMRDTRLPDLQSQLDNLAAVMKEQMNIVSNRGTSFPTMASTLTGSRRFLDWASTGPSDPIQRIQIADGDVKIAIFDRTGELVASTSLVGDLGWSGGAIYNAADPTDPTLASALQDWLRNTVGLNQARVMINSQGNFVVDLGTSEYGISFRDEVSSLPGSAAQDVTITFDADGTGTYGQTIRGFSYFFGLNDIVTSMDQSFIWDSQLLSFGFRPNITAPATLNFSDSRNGLGFASITIYPNENLSQIVQRINSDPTLNNLVRADLIPEGSGYRLRIRNLEGNSMQITEVGNAGLLGRLGMQVSNSGIGMTVATSPILLNDNTRLPGGALQFDVNTGKYFLSAGDNSIALQLERLFSEPVDFDRAGTTPLGRMTLAAYAGNIVGRVATDIFTMKRELQYQNSYLSSLEYRSAEISGVDIDAEFAMLIVFERSYQAASKIIATVQAMMDALLSIV
ncbi:MAG: flagellar hook-associated protein FlgK [Alphaproteobacteria bacterium]|nr:flagellar hook-associated protein FlgK [Alphaproteobacteria bacterium]